MKVLYISYDGLMEPLGNSQVFQYLKKLAPGKQIFLLTYEKPADWSDSGRRRWLAKEVREAGIRWFPLRYHKWPTSVATTYDLLGGLAVSSYLTLRHRIEIVHARSYVAATMALALKRVTGTKFIFDMRGFWADERAESGVWSKSSALYRTAKEFERRFLLEADAVVSLTNAGVAAMRNFDYLRDRHPPFYVIPTCTNLDVFRQREGRDTMHDVFTLGYVGGTGLWYDFDAAAECFRILLRMRPTGRIVIVNRSEHDYIRECLRRHGLAGANVEIKCLDYSKVAAAMYGMDAAVFFIKPNFSKLASAPTKLGELLACGVPCLTNCGVGDLDRIIEDNKAGIVLRGTDEVALCAGVRDLLNLVDDPATAMRCRAAAVRHFSLETGAEAYEMIYASLTSDTNRKALRSATGLADD